MVVRCSVGPLMTVEEYLAKFEPGTLELMKDAPEFFECCKMEAKLSADLYGVTVENGEDVWPEIVWVLALLPK